MYIICVYMDTCTRHTCVGPRTTCGSWGVSPNFTWWGLGIKFRPAGKCLNPPNNLTSPLASFLGQRNWGLEKLPSPDSLSITTLFCRQVKWGPEEWSCFSHSYRFWVEREIRTQSPTVSIDIFNWHQPYVQPAGLREAFIPSVARLARPPASEGVVLAAVIWDSYPRAQEHKTIQSLLWIYS